MALIFIHWFRMQKMTEWYLIMFFRWMEIAFTLVNITNVISLLQKTNSICITTRMMITLLNLKSACAWLNWTLDYWTLGESLTVTRKMKLKVTCEVHHITRHKYLRFIPLVPDLGGKKFSETIWGCIPKWSVPKYFTFPSLLPKLGLPVLQVLIF